MAGIVAHFKHGMLVHQKLPHGIKSIVSNHFKMFEIGLQGPDILYSFKPYKTNHIYEKGFTIHKEAGKSFFNMEKALQLNDNGLLSFIIGNICHYALDRDIHTFLNVFAPEDSLHTRAESNFDRYIKTKYNISTKRHELFPYKDIEFDIIAKFYGLDEKIISYAIKSMSYYMYLLRFKRFIKAVDYLFLKDSPLKHLLLPKQVDESLGLNDIINIFDNSIETALTLIREFCIAYQDKRLSLNDFEIPFDGN